MLALLCNADINIFTQRLKYLNILDIQKPDQTRSLLLVLIFCPGFSSCATMTMLICPQIFYVKSYLLLI